MCAMSSMFSLSSTCFVEKKYIYHTIPYYLFVHRLSQTVLKFSFCTVVMCAKTIALKYSASKSCRLKLLFNSRVCFCFTSCTVCCDMNFRVWSLI